MENATNEAEFANTHSVYPKEKADKSHGDDGACISSNLPRNFQCLNQFSVL